MRTLFRSLVTPLMLAVVLLAQANVLAADFAGKYANDTVKVTLLNLPGVDVYFGSITVNGKSYALKAEAKGEALAGTFEVEGTAFPLSAKLEGATLKLTSGGREHVLQRQGADPAPAPQPAPNGPNPLDVDAPAQPNPPQPSPPAVEALTTEQIVAKLKSLPAGAANPNREWTILVHLNADNDLERFGLQDLNEMEKGLSGNSVEIIVLIDRCAGFDKSEGDWQGARVYRVKPDANMSAIASEMLLDVGEVNMGDQATLAAFVEGALKAYPARQTALIMWNHGGGWSSMSNDFLAPGKERGDDIKLPELRGALETALPAANVKKLSIIGFDMCLMGQFEVATELAEVAEVMIASQAIEPGYGWPYDTIIPAFAKGTGGARRIGTDVVKAYDEFYKTVRKEKVTTQAALDLSLVGEANAKLNALLDKLQPTLSQNWPTLARACFYGEQYADRDDYKKGPYAQQSVDLLDLLKRLRAATPNFPAEAEYRDFMAVADRLVLISANSDRHRLSNGVAVYAPVQGQLVNGEYKDLKFTSTSKWPATIASMHALQKQDTTPPVITNIRIVDGDDKPINAFKPLSGHRYRVTVTGKNIIYTHAWTGRRDAKLGGMVIDVKSFVYDADWIQRVNEGEQAAHDIDLLMPKYQEGANELKDDFPGIALLLTNGRESRACTIDGSNLGQGDEWQVRALLRHPDLGPKPVQAMLYFDNLSFACSGIKAEMPQPDGTTRVRQIEPWPELEVMPVQEVVTDNDEIRLVATEAFKWERGLRFLVKLMDPGDYEAILIAETMGGLAGKARAKFRVDAYPELTQVNEGWKNFSLDVMPGTWSVSIPKAEGDVQIWNVKLKKTREPRLFEADVHSIIDNTRETWLVGVDLESLPHLRVYSLDDTGEPTSMVLGPALYGQSPDGKPAMRVLLVNLGGIPTDWRRVEGAPVTPPNQNNTPNPPQPPQPNVNNNPNPNPVPNPNPNVNNNPNPPQPPQPPPAPAENEERFRPVEVPDPRPLQLPQMQQPQQGNPWGF